MHGSHWVSSGTLKSDYLRLWSTLQVMRTLVTVVLISFVAEYKTTSIPHRDYVKRLRNEPKQRLRGSSLGLVLMGSWPSIIMKTQFLV